MKPIFISGSSSIHELNEDMIKNLDEIIKRNIPVIIGDCYGIDSLVQRYFHECNYNNVTVYYVGSFPRCHFLEFKKRDCNDKVTNETGRAFYEIKDIKMTEDCAGALMFWDEKSQGTKNNIERCKKLNKNYKIIKG